MNTTIISDGWSSLDITSAIIPVGSALSLIACILIIRRLLTLDESVMTAAAAEAAGINNVLPGRGVGGAARLQQQQQHYNRQNVRIAKNQQEFGLKKRIKP
jgi:hypothetical protein